VPRKAKTGGQPQHTRAVDEPARFRKKPLDGNRRSRQILSGSGNARQEIQNHQPLMRSRWDDESAGKIMIVLTPMNNDGPVHAAMSWWRVHSSGYVCDTDNHPAGSFDYPRRPATNELKLQLQNVTFALNSIRLVDGKPVSLMWRNHEKELPKPEDDCARRESATAQVRSRSREFKNNSIKRSRDAAGEDRQRTSIAA